MFEKILQLIYPVRCMYCNKVIDYYTKKCICDDCKNVIEEYIGIEKNDFFNKSNKWIDKNYAVLVYNDALSNAIHKMKYKNKPQYAKILCKYMKKRLYEILNKNKIEVVISVPIHKKRFKKRGYNQSHLLAKECVDKIDVIYMKDFIKRIKNTKPQNGLNVVYRYNNLEGAFGINKKSKKILEKYKTFLIIDDIYTTGSTVESCAKILKEFGAIKVYSLCLALATKVK